MNWIRTISFPSFLLLCVVLRAQTNSGELNDAIVARVNGKAILLSQLKESALDLQVPISSLTMEGLMGEGFRKAITAQVDEELLVQSAIAEKMMPDENDVTRRVDLQIKQLVARLGGEEELSKFLKRSHLSLDALRRMLIVRETRQDMSASIVAKRVKVSGSEIEDFKIRRSDAGKNAEEILLGQILVRCPKSDQDTELGKQLYTKALEIARQAGKEPAKFGELALQKSDDPATRERGGILGWVDPQSLQESLRVRVKSMSSGQVSEPVASDLGFHVLYVLDQHTARDLLFAEKFDQEREKLVQALREKATIEIYPLK